MFSGHELVNHAAIAGPLSNDGTALDGRPEEVALAVEDHARDRLVSAVWQAREIVDNGFAPASALLRRELINDAAIVPARIDVATTIGRAEKIAVRIERRILERIYAVGRTVEDVRRTFGPLTGACRREFEGRTQTLRSATGFSAMEMTGGVDGEPTLGHAAFVLREGMDRRERPLVMRCRTHLEDQAMTARSAEARRAVKVARGIEDKLPIIGAVTISTAEIVEVLFFPAIPGAA